MAEPTARAPADYIWSLFAPVLIHALLFQTSTVLMRVGGSYRAIELGLPYLWYGAISASYALVPIFLAVPVGRYIDRGHDARVVVAGAALVLLASVGFVVKADGPWTLLLHTMIGGVGHLLLMAGHQTLTLRCSGPVSREAVFGHYMVSLSLAQMIGPLLIGWVAGDATTPPTQTLFYMSLGVAVMSMATAFAFRAASRPKNAGAAAPTMPVLDILRTRGLAAVLFASVMTVSAFDLIVVYLPLLGVERHIEARHVGWMLMTRALASILARVVYTPLLRVQGRAALTFWTIALAAVGFGFLAAPLSLPWLYGANVLLGAGLGLAVTICLSNVVLLAPPEARATALTLRLTGNRLGQFAIPFLASVLAGATGVGGVFIVIAVALTASGAAVAAMLKGK